MDSNDQGRMQNCSFSQNPLCLPQLASTQFAIMQHEGGMKLPVLAVENLFLYTQSIEFLAGSGGHENNCHVSMAEQAVACNLGF